jgi:mono/diheme cytochrome c family protein
MIGTTPANTETCAVCHGAGAVADVAIEHGVP